MRKYIVAKRDLISIDDENLQNIECIDSCSTGIDWAWIIPQDGELNGEPVKKVTLLLSSMEEIQIYLVEYVLSVNLMYVNICVFIIMLVTMATSVCR